MPRKAAGLTAAKVRTAGAGRYGDGGGLYLLVKPSGARSWVLRYTIEGKTRDMGLGLAGSEPAAVTLAEARDRAAELARMVRSGVDPLTAREAEQAERRAAEQRDAAQGMTFRAVAERYLSAHDAGWRNPKHRQQWRNTLATYAYPHMGDLPVAEVGTGHVMAALEPIWTAKPETATRVRGRIEAVIDYARARGWRDRENPARWRGHIANMLPTRSKVAPVEHHAALPWRDVGPFMVALGKREGTAALALQFAILTAARSGEVLGARWCEVDLAEAVWTVPGARMKAGKEHRVPLSKPALAVLRAAAVLRTSQATDAFVFPGARPEKPLSVMALAMVLRRMERGELTVHGFRSTFRDWCAEATSYANHVAEAALAHSLRDKVEAAYRRGDVFDHRRRLMDDWAAFCARSAVPTGRNIRPIRAAISA
jgi:integrase